MTSVTMIDYGIGNYRSVQKALEYVGASVRLERDPDAILKANKLILPGVGAFGAAIDAVRARDQEPAIHQAVQSGTPFLGICVGMQLLFDTSDEIGFHHGLGLIKGDVRRFSKDLGLKIPHMGWNELEHNGSKLFLDGVRPNSYAYFVHSYQCQPSDPTHALALTDYGGKFTSVVGRDNIYGIQFHAEKSQRVGLQMLENFVKKI